jgi:ABC-type branched-subunit amino acid transport system substrate-binding protein
MSWNPFSLMANSAMRRQCAMVVFLALLPLPSPPLRAASSSEIEKGRQIYLRGVGTSEITAVLGNGGGIVQASVVPCAGCHGLTGSGRTEAGVTSADIRWLTLSRPTPPGDSTLRKRPAYTRTSLLRAIALGVDSAGTPLASTMPRYHLSSADAANLLAWLENLSSRLDPGVDENSINVGVIIPPAALLDRAVTMAALDAVAAYVEEANRTGFYGRRLRLSYFELPADPGAIRSELGEWLRANRIFVTVSSFLAGLDLQVTSALAESGVPMVGAISPNPLIDGLPYAGVFYLDGGLAAQAHALVEEALRRFPDKRRLAVLTDKTGRRDELPAAIAERASSAGWETVIVRSDDPCPQVDADAVLVLRPGLDLDQLSANLHSVGKAHLLMVPAVLLTAPLQPGHSAGKVAIWSAYPFLPSDYNPDASAKYRRLASSNHLKTAHQAAQFAAIAGLEILMEALRRTGRDLSREGLIESLESFSRFETGWTPPISFGPNRRAGIENIHIIEME